MAKGGEPTICNSNINDGLRLRFWFWFRLNHFSRFFCWWGSWLRVCCWGTGHDHEGQYH